MCGITGFWITRNENIERAALEKMAATMYHRGPDGYGYHVDSSNGLAMAHARLTIIDFQSGHQPLFNDKNVLTVNGEFYDYKRIRTGLKLEGAKFRSKSDSEIALHLYEKHGLDFVNHLRGEFGFALYDAKEEKLILVRDRFGIKPLFFHNSEKGFYYGSEIKAILAHPEVPKAFDAKGVLHQLMHTMVPGSSLFKNIHAVKPGHMMIVKKNGNGFDVQERCYWDVNFPEKDERDGSKDEKHHIQRTREELTEAVALRLEADVPVGCYLSGGIDSCSMLGLASSIQQSPVKAYTISFDHKAYDESPIAREMAEMTKADHEIMNLKAEDLYGDNYVKTLWHSERAFYNTLGVAKYCMSKRVRDSGYRVVVTGEGADELFSGYPFFKKDMLKLGADSKNRAEMESYQALMEKTNSLFKGAIMAEENVSHAAFDQVCGFTPTWIQTWMLTLRMAKPLLSKELQNELAQYDPIAAIAETFDTKQLNGRHHLDKAQYTWIKTMLECQILNWGGDRVDMANSMESRPAFLDHHVAEMAVQIPPHMRIKGNVEKWVLREAMKNILPETLYKREKFAFMAPPANTEKKKALALDQLIGTYLNEDALAESGIFDPAALNNFLHQYKNDTDVVSLTRKDALMNHIVGLQALHSLFIKQETGILQNI